MSDSSNEGVVSRIGPESFLDGRAMREKAMPRGKQR